MKKHLSAFLIVCSTCLYSQVQIDSLPSFPGPERDDAVMVCLKSKIYCGTGFGSFFQPLNDWWTFDISSKKWTRLQDIPFVPRQYVRAFTIDDYIYLFGGWSDARHYFNSLWRFDVKADEWQEMAPLPAGPRWAGIAFSIGEYGYVGLGQDSSGVLNDFWEYKPSTNSWQRLADFPGDPRSVGISAAVDGMGVVGLGRSGDLTALEDFWVFNPLNKSWHQLQLRFPKKLTYSSAAVLDHRLYIALGQNDTFFDNNMYRLDPTRQSLLDFGSIPVKARRGASMVSDGNSLFMLWGLDQFYHRRNELYQIKVPELQSDQKLEMFPNPVQGKALVYFPDNVKEVEVYSILGQHLYSREIQRGKGWEMLNLNILSPGSYILRVFLENGIYISLKFVKA